MCSGHHVVEGRPGATTLHGEAELQRGKGSFPRPQGCRGLFVNGSLCPSSALPYFGGSGGAGRLCSLLPKPCALAQPVMHPGKKRNFSQL